MPDVQGALPADLSGLTALDIGGYTDRMAQWCLDRGATLATMIDSGECLLYPWSEPGVSEGSRVRFVWSDLHEWCEPADVVICSNVIYHVKNPLAALAHIRKLVRRLLLLQTSFVEYQPERMVDGWRWYPNGEGHSNGTVWCRPTLDGLEDYLHRAGFPVVELCETKGDHVLVRCPV